MRIPLKPQPRQQHNLIPLQLSPPLKLPLSTGPPTQCTQLLLLRFTQPGHIGFGNGAFEIAVSMAGMVGCQGLIVGVPSGWFEEETCSVVFRVLFGL